MIQVFIVPFTKEIFTAKQIHHKYETRKFIILLFIVQTQTLQLFILLSRGHKDSCLLIIEFVEPFLSVEWMRSSYDLLFTRTTAYSTDCGSKSKVNKYIGVDGIQLCNYRQNTLSISFYLSDIYKNFRYKSFKNWDLQFLDFFHMILPTHANISFSLNRQTN